MFSFDAGPNDLTKTSLVGVTVGAAILVIVIAMLLAVIIVLFFVLVRGRRRRINSKSHDNLTLIFK